MTLTYCNGLWYVEYNFENDLGFKRARSVIDVMEQRKGVLFRWRDHYERFLNSCRGCLIPLEYLPPEEELLKKIAYQLKDSNQTASVWLQATPGDTKDTKNPSFFPTLSISIHPFPARPENAFELCTVNAQRDFPQYKLTAGYGIASLFEAQIKAEGYDKLLYLSDRLGILEGVYENILFVNDDEELLAPNLGILEGITRKVVLEIARGCKIFKKVIEKPVWLWQLDHCKEAFLTSTTLWVAEVDSVNGDEHPFPEHKFTRILKEKFIEYRENYYKERGA